MIGRENNFNLLRFIFASLVIVSHVPELIYGNRSNELLTQIFSTMSFGELAVDSFFIISGYLIVMSWFNNPSFLKFLSSRVLRIVPGFVIASLVCALIIGPIYGQENYWQKFDYVYYAKSLLQLKYPNIPPTFFGSNHPYVNGSMWTIAYEFKCYLVVLLFGMTSGFRHKWLWLAVGLTITLIYTLNELSVLNLASWKEYFRLSMLFFLGGIYYLHGEKILKQKKYTPFAACALIAFMFVPALCEIAVGIFLGFLLLEFALYGKVFAVFNKLPDVSYGIYLYAWPINKIVLWHFPAINAFICILLVFFVSIVAGLLSWYSVERPALRLKGLLFNPRKKMV